MSTFKNKLMMLILCSGLGLMSNPGVVLAQPGVVQGIRSPAELAALNQVDQAISQLQSHPTAQPPSVTLRPAAGMFDSCEVDVLASTSGRGYQLRVAVPDSVSSIEVVPASTSNRQFRIRLEENNSAAQPIARLDSLNSNLLSRFRSPKEIHHWMNEGQNEEKSDSRLNNVSRSGFTNNPFFATSAVGSSRATTRNLRAAQPPADDQIKVVSLIQGGNSNQYATKIRAGIPQIVREPKIESETIKTDRNTLESFVIEGEISVPRKTIGQPIRQIRVAANSPIAVSGVNTTPAKLKLEQVASVSVAGPSQLKIGATGDYTVRVKNTSNTDITNVNVRLASPQGLDILVIERKADFDQQNRLLVWNIPTLKAGEQFQTRYRATTSSVGEFLHSIDMGQGASYSVIAAELFTVGVKNEE